MGRCPVVLESEVRESQAIPGEGPPCFGGQWGGVVAGREMASCAPPQPSCLFGKAQAGICPHDPEASGCRAQSWPWGQSGGNWRLTS